MSRHASHSAPDEFLSGLAALALGAAGLGAAALAGAAPASAATGCSVAYSVTTQWDTGFGAAITITNLGSPLTSWTLGCTYAATSTVTQRLERHLDPDRANVTVANAAWNGSLATNGTVTTGANFSYSGTNTAPTAFTLNGVGLHRPGQARRHHRHHHRPAHRRCRWPRAPPGPSASRCRRRPPANVTVTLAAHPATPACRSALAAR